LYKQGFLGRVDFSDHAIGSAQPTGGQRRNVLYLSKTNEQKITKEIIQHLIFVATLTHKKYYLLA
jgi:hypothetical protein